MRPKNVMLLGFVNRAVEYLDRHMDEEPDTRLAELKNIDLESIREELADNLDASLGTMESTMNMLLKAGNEAFDDFIDGNLGRDRNSISNQFNKIFDIDLDIDTTKNQADLAKLLAFYNLEDDFDVEEYDSSEEDEYLQEIKKNTSNAEVKPVSPSIIDEQEPVSDEELDSIFSEIIENEEKKNNEKSEIIEKENSEVDNSEEENIEEENSEEDNNEEEIEVTKEEPKDDPKDDSKEYVSSLIEDLKSQLKKEEEIKKEKEAKESEVFNDVSNIYPYLPKAFVNSVYELKDSLSNDYRIGEDVVLLHRIKFNSVENLRKFVEIVLNHNYAINADENKLIVDVIKRFKNAEGKIINNIYGIANQGYLLEGTYEGYNIIVEE